MKTGTEMESRSELGDEVQYLINGVERNYNKLVNDRKIGTAGVSQWQEFSKELRVLKQN